MTSFNYTGSALANLVGGTPGANVSNLVQLLNDLRTFLNNANLDATNITDGAITQALMSLSAQQQLGLNDGAQVGRGKTSIATLESRTNVAYGTLPTPDQVTGVVLPTDGLLFIYYSALWRVTSAVTGSAAIFLGANQLKKAQSNSAPTVQETTNTGQFFGSLGTSSTSPGGLDNAPSAVSDSSDVTTGQIVGFGSGLCVVKAAAGTYNVSVQFKTSSGTLEVKNRLLCVEARGYA